jgi:hypothetical protein
MGEIEIRKDLQLGVDPEDYTEGTLKEIHESVMHWKLGFVTTVATIWPYASLPAEVFPEGYFAFRVLVSPAWDFIMNERMSLMSCTDQGRLETWSTE